MSGPAAALAPLKPAAAAEPALAPTDVTADAVVSSVTTVLPSCRASTLRTGTGLPYATYSDHPTASDTGWVILRSVPLLRRTAGGARGGGAGLRGQAGA